MGETKKGQPVDHNKETGHKAQDLSRRQVPKASRLKQKHRSKTARSRVETARVVTGPSNRGTRTNLKNKGSLSHNSITDQDHKVMQATSQPLKVVKGHSSNARQGLRAMLTDRQAIGRRNSSARQDHHARKGQIPDLMVNNLSQDGMHRRVVVSRRQRANLYGNWELGIGLMEFGL